MLAVLSRDEEGMLSERVRLADLLAAMSVATDLGNGQEPEKAIRACLGATALARRWAPPRGASDVYYTALLRHLGCTATAHEEAYLGGDELVSRSRGRESRLRESSCGLRLATPDGRGQGPTGCGTLPAPCASARRAIRPSWERSARSAPGSPSGWPSAPGSGTAYTRSSSRGTARVPQGLATEDICLPARIAEVGHQAVIFDRLSGPESDVEVIRRRARGWFDPGVAEAFARFGADILDEIGVWDVWEAVLDAEPEPRRTIGRGGLDGLARAFADMVDLKSPFMLGHSSEVAALLERAAGALGFGPEAVTDLRRAELLHDLGRVAVSNGIWEKQAAPSTTEWERIRLHPYQSERILARSRVLEPLAAWATDILLLRWDTKPVNRIRGMSCCPTTQALTRPAPMPGRCRQPRADKSRARHPAPPHRNGSHAGCPGARLGHRNSDRRADRRARGDSARPC
jgi:hypothetical protein